MTVDIEERLASGFAAGHPQDAAAIIESLPLDAVVAFLSSLSPDSAAGILEHTDANMAALCLTGIDASLAADITAALPLAIAATLLRRLDSACLDATMAGLSAEHAERLQDVLRYPEGSAGALMDPRILTAQPDLFVRDALERLRQHAVRAAYYLYIVDRDGILVGVVSMRDLMLADPAHRIASVMEGDVVTMRVGASTQAVLAHPGWLAHQVLPVVDDAGRLVGALRHKLLRRLAHQASAPGGTASVASALGELYKIGLVGLLNLGASADEPPQSPPQGRPHD